IFNSKRSVCPLALPGGGPVLGHSKDFKFETYSEVLITGDRLFLYTDGLIEARNADEIFYEKSRMNQVMRSSLDLSPKLAAERLISDVNKHMRGEPYQDDVTFLIVDVR
ncbi:MAG: serine/threonine-protein phosphatase, partial [Fibrobacteres bacterium]|nr:serine/threonine-protein phosphatase [Fibrobacterota bacterium]